MSLSYREREIIKLVAGISDGYIYTREEVGHIFKVPTSEIDAIVERAMRKVERCIAGKETELEFDSSRVSGVNIAITIPEFCDEHFLADKLVDLYVALDGMHKGAGGSGLVVNDGQSRAGMLKLEGTPIQ
jgi:hypothetical protein